MLQGDSLGVGWGFGAAGCQINGLCPHCPLLGEAGEPGSDSRMKSDKMRKGEAMPGAPACPVLAALALLTLALLCFAAAHCGSCLTTAWTPKEGKGTKPGLESRSSGNFSSRPTSRPAVKSRTTLPLGCGRCQTPELTPARPMITLMATHTHHQ